MAVHVGAGTRRKSCCGARFERRAKKLGVSPADIQRAEQGAVAMAVALWLVVVLVHAVLVPRSKWACAIACARASVLAA